MRLLQISWRSLHVPVSAHAFCDSTPAKIKALIVGQGVSRLATVSRKGRTYFHGYFDHAGCSCFASLAVGIAP
jgi:hypothetical protein